MKKKILVVAAICSMLIFSSCSDKTSGGTERKKDNAVNNTVVNESSDEDINNKNDNEVNNEDVNDRDVTLNKASGDISNFIKTIDNYFVSLDGDLPKGEKLIVTPVIYYVDKSDETDIKLYGNFYSEHYDISDKQLTSKGGESKQGICHIRKQNNEYVVTKLEEAEDGSYYAESISKFVTGVEADLKPSLEELYAGSEITENALEYAKNVILYRYAAENGLDNEAYTDCSQKTVNFTGIRNIRYNGEVYTETGETSYIATDNSAIIEIENVVTDINGCQEKNASDFGKCNIIPEEGQILVNCDGYWRIFEK